MECTILRDETLAVLYGEADAATTKRVLEHEAVCAACREERASLARLRETLGAWRVPELGRSRRLQAWRGLSGLAAAAALFLSLGTAAGFAYRAGRGAAQADVKALLAEHEARHAAEMQTLQVSLERSASSQAAPEATLLKKVEDMIHESEARQAVLWNATLTDLSESAEARRRYDLARVSAGLSYLDGKSGQQTARTTELVGYVLQAAQQK
jgi:hypothetical protein